MNRSKLRENIFKLLYTAEFQKEEEMPQQLSLYFEFTGDEEIQPKDQLYIEEKYRHVTEHIEEIDEMLNQVSEGWKTKRMGKVDLAILRLALYEMKYDDDVPVGVAINEAVELAKSFGREESASFINGILGKLARENDEK
ncbi:MAG: transcription antitermination factor NusB [Fusicatenibacter sp.]|nr:transcription antitermination factor NusB [Fusicatenibacter sp.]